MLRAVLYENAIEITYNGCEKHYRQHKMSNQQHKPCWYKRVDYHHPGQLSDSGTEKGNSGYKSLDNNAMISVYDNLELELHSVESLINYFVNDTLFSENCFFLLMILVVCLCSINKLLQLYHKYEF